MSIGRTQAFIFRIIVFFTALVLNTHLYAQSHISVPLEDPVYAILENAQIRGLLLPMPGAKPYTRNQVLAAIDSITASGTGLLSAAERQILENTRKKYSHSEAGLDWQKGAYTIDRLVSPLNIPWNTDIGAGGRFSLASAVYSGDRDNAVATDNLITVYTTGDLGQSFSYGFIFVGHLTLAPRRLLGDDYNTFYEGFTDDPVKGHFNRKMEIWDEPDAYIPYTYRKYWDGAVFFPAEIDAGGFQPWPDKFSIAPHFLGEMSGGLFSDVITWRFGRMRREWASMAEGRSIVFNGTAQPFVAIETSFNPVYWFSASAITGALEYDYRDDLKTSAWASQNLFSMEMVEYNFRNFFHASIGTNVVYAKRFELGYIFPVINNFLYQDSVGDFDNMGIFANLKLQSPGIGSFWVSFFGDDIDPGMITDLFKYDRQTFALQAGSKIVIPWLPFASASLLYTKIEPYTYTHHRLFVPWYNSGYENEPMPMESKYSSMGTPLGYYLNPNSDELLFRVEAMPTVNTKAHFQYQMIRHGAEHGSGQVDGSSWFSELDPDGGNRSNKPELKKFFLKDGAYRWQHIFQIGADHTLESLPLPVRIFGNVGLVYSFYTNIDGKPNSGAEYSWSFINTPEYPKSTAFYLSVGVGLYL
ncbi:MAG: hypothetical protein LBI90_03535 [Treponema sp.]|jgi:hypothetical protein|nr:hypothetical protein [Treponema sp.]